MLYPRVVITGLAVITPIGLTAADFWANLVAGRSGVRAITRFDTTGYPYKLAAEVNGFEPLNYMDAKLASRVSRYTQFAVAAASMAATSARLNMNTERSERVGVIVASLGQVKSTFELTAMLDSGYRRIDPLFLHKTGAHMAAAQVGRFIGARGPNSSVNTACASGTDAIGAALNMIRLGHADVILAGGTDDTVSPISVASMGILGALSRSAEPGRSPRPFDRNRDGAIVGEGAGMLVLESLEHARSRGATIMAELAGAGWSFDAFNEAAPDSEGESLAMKAALRNAGMKPQDIQYINAHGTGTRLNDATETKAIKIAFGSHAPNLAISSNKSVMGHLSCGAGAVESAATVMTLVNQVIPPTINYQTPDPECDLDFVPNVARQTGINACIKNGFGLGGQNCSLVFRRYEGN